MDPPPLLPPHPTSCTTTTTATPSSSSSSSSSPASLPRLPVLSRSKPHRFCRPTKRIHTGADLPRFLSSLAYRDIGLFLLQLNRALCPRKTPPQTDNQITTTTTTTTTTTPSQLRTFPLDAPRSDPEQVARLRALLDRVEALMDEAPPEPGPRRFGNAAFRRWHGLLERRADGLLREHIPPQVWGWGGCASRREREQREGSDNGDGAGGGDDGSGGGGGGDDDVVGDDGAEVLEEVKAYFMGAWGSAQRLDYGTGHELSFLAFLGCLWKLGAFGNGGDDGEVERSVVLGVFEPYLRVVRRLILTYTLEPAGSHGVWGLDDHSFLPYIFGSAQLTRPIAEGEPMPLEGSVPGAPRPAEVARPAAVALHRDANMYFSAIGFINDVKKGPFWEHSPILYDVSGIKDGWGKINKGMIKMFNAEVLFKFPVVQHFPFGSLFSWDPDPDAAAAGALPARSAHLASHGAGVGAAAAAAAAAGSAAVGVPAGPGIPYSRAPWARADSSGPSMPRGGVPDTGPPPPTSFPRGKPGTASNQFAVTKAPWAKE